MDGCLAWEAPGPHRRTMGVMFERDLTPTSNLAAGFVRLPVGGEQPKLSRHEGEEIYFVVRGRGLFDRGNQIQEVQTRGAVYVRPFDPHRWTNIGEEDLELFYVNTPSAFGRVGGYADIVSGWEQTGWFPEDDPRRQSDAKSK